MNVLRKLEIFFNVRYGHVIWSEVLQQCIGICLQAGPCLQVEESNRFLTRLKRNAVERDDAQILATTSD